MCIISHTDETTWPKDIVSYLDANYDILSAWEKGQISYQESHAKVRERDNALSGLGEIISNYYLHGYHCSRLTEKEITSVLTNGMKLSNKAILSDRVRLLQEEGIINMAIADLLINENDADQDNRQNMIWFTFFKPHLAGESGINRLMRYWGGEALFCCHESNPVTGSVLERIGIPCIIEARIPIKALGISYLDVKFVRQYLNNRGIMTDSPGTHEGYSTIPISPLNIIDITKWPDQKFKDLTSCDKWDWPLTAALIS